jgi:hypothetical protein
MTTPVEPSLINKLHAIIGYVENGSEQTMRLFQDDATKDFLIIVGPEKRSRRYFASSLQQVIDKAYEGEKQDFE